MSNLSKKSCVFCLVGALVLFIVFWQVGIGLNRENTEYLPIINTTEPYRAIVNVDLSKSFPTNKLLLGNNVQWVDRGDEILSKGTIQFRPEMLQKIIDLQPTVLRYPGGSLSDLYRWEHGIGEIDERKRSKRFHSSGADRMLFGTKEFLKLCSITGAEPMFTANVITAPAQETARWLTSVNNDRIRDDNGELLPKAIFWEIGNEPYLIDDNQKHLAVTAKEFSAKLNYIVPMLRDIDPEIKIGIPLRSDDFDGIPATPLPGFNEEVLSLYTDTIDFVALHNTYFPFLWSKIPPNKEQIFIATMAATELVRKDLNITRKQLERLRNEKSIPIAITEMNSMFSIGKGETDKYIRSLTGALYISDLLILLAKEPDILMANYWSLTGNWEFGAIDKEGVSQATYKVLKAFHNMFNGNHVKTHVQGPTFNSITTGFVTGQNNIDFLNVLATKTPDNQLLIWAINKHPNTKAAVEINLSNNQAIKKTRIKTLTTKDYFSVYEAQKMMWGPNNLGTSVIPILLPPHSINIISVEL